MDDIVVKFFLVSNPFGLLKINVGDPMHILHARSSAWDDLHFQVLRVATFFAISKHVNIVENYILNQANMQFVYRFGFC